MSEQTAGLEAFFAREAQAMTAACTTCGACMDVCPVTVEAGIADQEAANIVGGVLAQLRGEAPLDGGARAWVDHCNGCGACVPACPEAVNPRRLLMFAQSLDASQGRGTPQVFRKLARAVRLMAAMQLPPADVNKLFRHRADARTDVVFYTGCNAIRTPHVLLNAMQVLDALQVNYQVAGGPASCCGIAQTRTEGNVKAGGQVMSSTLARFERMGASQVLSWCPSCQLQVTETYDGFSPSQVSMEHVSSFLLEHADRLRELWTTPVPRRVVLHAHAGLAELGRNVATLLCSIPGLEVIDTVVETGYTCGVAGSARSPALAETGRQRLREQVKASGADAVVSLYHSCHRALLEDVQALGVALVNFTDLLVLGLGGEPVPDRYQQLVGLSADEVAAEVSHYLAENGVQLEPDWFERHGADLFSMAEYRGGLECFATGARSAASGT